MLVVHVLRKPIPKGSTVAKWECEAGCPVAKLDEQTGELGNNHRESKANGSSSIWGSGKASPTAAIPDTGGASRFFKQVQSDTADSVGS